MTRYRTKPKIDDPEWICVKGKYDPLTNMVTCNSPAIALEDLNTFLYEVDVSINSQQFTGFPLTFRFYSKKSSIIITSHRTSH